MNMAKLLHLHRLAALLLLLAAPMQVLAQTGPASPVPALTPKAVVSLEYPNPWDFNKLIALTADGRHLVDASDKTRHIRVWDWQEKTVAKRLLLNEAALEFSDGKVHKSVLSVAGGQELTLSPDGRFMAACANKWTMIWDLGSSQRLARVGGLLDPAPGIPEGARVEHGCRWLSFSPDGSWLAVADGGTLFLTEQDWEASEQAAARRSERLTREPGKFTLTPQDYADMARGKDKSFKGGVALYDTRDWRIVRFLRLRPWEHVKSPVLFTADGKQAIGLAYQYPAVFPKEVINTPAAENLITNRLVRWDVASGEIVSSMELPKISFLTSWGIRWSWLPGGREVWWDNWPGHRREQMVEEWNCEAPAPAFESEAEENCGYWWAVSVLDIETGKRRYLAPVKKNAPKSGSVGQPERVAYVAPRLSPNGRHLVLLKKSMWKAAGVFWWDSSMERMAMDVYSIPEFRLVGSFARGEEDNYAIGVGDLVFSSDSRWLALQMKNSAWIFDLGD